jgi:hypothetical protein
VSKKALTTKAVPCKGWKITAKHLREHDIGLSTARGYAEWILDRTFGLDVVKDAEYDKALLFLTMELKFSIPKALGSAAYYIEQTTLTV